MRSFLKSHPRLRRLAIIFGVYMLVCVALTTALFVWAQTAAAERFLLRRINGALAVQGLSLEVEDFLGPLPQRLGLGALRLSDAHGVWLQADGAEVRLRPAALARRTIDITDLVLERPQLFRLPDLPPASGDSSGQISLDLPVAIVLESLRIEEGSVFPAVFVAPETRQEPHRQGPEPETGPTGPFPALPGTPALSETMPAGHSRAALSPGAGGSGGWENPVAPAGRSDRTDPAGPYSPDHPGTRNSPNGPVRLHPDGTPAQPGRHTPDSPAAPHVTADTGFPVPAVPDSSLPEPLALTATGNGRLVRGKLAFSLDLDLLHADGSGLRLSSRLGPPHREQTLPDTGETPRTGAANASLDDASFQLAVRVREGRHGLAAAVLGDARLPAYALDFSGQGPLEEWDGTFSLETGERGPGAPFNGTQNNFLMAGTGQGRLEGRLRLETAGRQERSNRLTLGAGFTPGPQLAPEQRRRLGPAPSLDAALTLAENILLVERLEVSLAACDLRVERLRLEEQDNRLAFAGSYRLDLHPELFEDPASTAPAPGSGYILTGDVSGVRTANDSRIVLDGSFRETGPAALPASGRLRLEALREGALLTLESLGMEGMGLRLQARGSYDTGTGSGSGVVTAATVDREEWTRLVARFTPVAPEGTWGGNLSADLEIAVDGPAAKGLPENTPAWPRVTAAAVVTGNALDWPWAQADATLGATAALHLRLAGGGGAPYRLDLAGLDAGGLSARGQAVLTVPEGPFPPAGSAFFSTSRLQADADVTLADIGTLEPAVSGPLRTVTSLRGPLNALFLELETTSPAVRTAGGVLEHVQLGISGNLTGLGGTATTSDGRLRLELADSPAGAAQLASAWSIRMPAAGPATLHLSEAEGTLSGAGLHADLEVALPGQAADATLRLNGTAGVEIRDWSGIAALTGQPLEGEGAGLHIALHGDANGQSATARLEAKRLVLRDPDAARAAWRMEGLEARLEAHRLFSAPDVAFSAQAADGSAGPLAWSVLDARAEGRGGRGVFHLLLSDGPVRSSETAGPPEAGERLSVAGAWDLHARSVRLERLALLVPDPEAAPNPSGPLTRVGEGSVVSADSGLYLTSPATISWENGFAARNIAADVLPAGRVEGSFVRTTQGAELDLRLDRLSLAAARIFTNALPPAGLVSGTARLQGQGARVTGELAATALLFQDARTAAQDEARADLTVQANATLGPAPGSGFSGLAAGPGRLHLNGRAVLSRPERQAPDGVLEFDIPFRPDSGLALPDERAPLAARFAWEGPAASLWRLVPYPERDLSGYGRVECDVSGTLETPVYAVQAYLAEGRYEDRVLGFLLTDIALEAESSGPDAVRALLAARDGQGGTVAVEASITPDALEPEEDGPRGFRRRVPGPRLDLRGQVNHLDCVHRDDLSLLFSGIFHARGPLAAPSITGEFEIERGELVLLSTLSGGVRTLEISDRADQDAPLFFRGPRCDVRVRVPERFFIRGRGLDSEWEGDLRVRGSLANPALTGALHPVRGYFEILSRPFEFTAGSINFLGGDRINPGLNLELTYSASNITAVALARGTAEHPTITLTSTPPLPQDQILAQVLFNKNMSGLGRFEALQVANSLRELSGVGGQGLDALARLRQTFGFDMLRVGSSGDGPGEGRSVSGVPDAAALGGSRTAGISDDNSVPTLEAGKYINDAIYVGVEQGTEAETTGVRVEVELRPGISLQGKTTPTSSEVGVGWKKDY